MLQKASSSVAHLLSRNLCGGGGGGKSISLLSTGSLRSNINIRHPLVSSRLLLFDSRSPSSSSSRNNLLQAQARSFTMLHPLQTQHQQNKAMPPPPPQPEETEEKPTTTPPNEALSGIDPLTGLPKRGNKRAFTSDDPIEALLARNEHWSSSVSKKYPELFPSLASTQKPQILWFGCSDSRVPETTILNLLPGEVFVHRNIANCLPPNDLSSLSVLQYAVEVLQVKHIIVCGHYGCGGVAAACAQKKLGLIDVWLKNIRDVRAKNMTELDNIKDPELRVRRLVELHTKAQVHNVLHNANVIDAMKERGLKVHGFVYDVANGKIRKLKVPDDHATEIYDLNSDKPLH
ncbi:hypothetical protein TWF281_000445 [Arthrobotrys megalospora]